MKYLPLFIAISLGTLTAQQLPDAAPFRSAAVQFVDANGLPLAGGLLYTCVAGLSCPGNPQATYTDSTATVQNPNPIVLDSAGRAQVWLGPQAYRLVLQDANAVQQWTQDNVEDTTLYFVNFVKTAGTATLITYTAPLTGAVQRTVANRLADAISILDFGVVCDGVTENSAAAFESMFSSNPGLSLRFPGSTCVLDNSAGPIVITNWTGGTISGAKGATLSCTTLTQRCLEFDGAHNFKISGLTIEYGPMPMVRGGTTFNLYLLNSTDGILSDMTFTHGPNSGLVIQQCDNIQTDNISYTNMLANGLLMTNSTHIATSNTYCNGIQDACEEFSGYDPYAGVPAGVCQYVTVTNLISYNSFAGALFNSCPDSTLNGFTIYGSYVFGIAIYQDSGTTTTKFPTRVTISNGTINHTGFTPTLDTFASGIFINEVTTPTVPLALAISNVTITDSAFDGISVGVEGSMSTFTNVNLDLSNIVVDTTGNNTPGVPDSGGVCYRFASKGSIQFSNLQALRCGGRAMEIGPYDFPLQVTGTGLYIYNVQTDNAGAGSPDSTAFYANLASTDTVVITNVLLVDDRNPALATSLADNGIGKVLMSDIQSYIPNGTYASMPGASTSIYTRADHASAYNTYFHSTAYGHPGAKLTAGEPINAAGQFPETEIGYQYDTTGTGASLVPVISGGVITGVTVGSGGTGYIAGQTCVVFNAGGGAIAAAYPVITAGVITSVVVYNGGSGYSSATATATNCGYGWIQSTLAGLTNTNLLINPNGGRVLFSSGGLPTPPAADDGFTAVQIPGGALRTGTFVNAGSGFQYNGTAGYSGTKTAGSCVLTIQGGIITNVTGC